MTLTASHRDLDLDVLEQLSSGAHSLGSTVVSDSPEITGCVVLATCNRFEVYLDTDPTAGGPDGSSARTYDELVTATVGAVARASGLSPDDVAASLQAGSGPDVARHLFAVASGLDSMVVGEREVAGQVRRALHTARAQGTTSPRLERLFQTASRTSRAVGARTGLAGTGRSVVGLALDLASNALAEHGTELARCRVLLIGTGSYAGASLTALRARGVEDVAVYSPSGRAAQFVAERALEAVPADCLLATLATVDVVVSCSGALGPVLTKDMVLAARSASAGLSGGGARPVALVDLALQHDIDPAAADVPGVALIDLRTVQRHAPESVSLDVAAGRAIVADSAARFEASLAGQRSVPTVVAMRDRVDAVVAAEVARVRARTDDPAVAEQVERSLRRVAAALLHHPSVRAREHARDGRDEEFRAGLRTVFGTDDPGSL